MGQFECASPAVATLLVGIYNSNVLACYMAFILLSVGTSAAVQQPTSSPSSEERARRLTLQGSELLILPQDPARTFGVLTLVPPTSAGEMVRVNVPIGELISRAARAVARSKQRRAEKAAHDEVMRSLAEFKARQPK